MSGSLFQDDEPTRGDIPVTLDRLVAVFLNRWSDTLRGGDRTVIERELRELIAEARTIESA